MGNRTSNSTGIGVRGGYLQTGGLSTQPIPIQTAAGASVAQPAQGVTPIIVENEAAASLTIPTAQLPGLVQARPAQSAIPMAQAVASVLPEAAQRLGAVRTAQHTDTVGISDPVVLGQPRFNTEESLSLSELAFRNGEYQQPDRNGISPMRPELVSFMNFQPIYFGNSGDLNDHGLLLDVQYQARALRENTLVKTLQDIRQTDNSEELSRLQTAFDASFDKVESAAKFYQNTINTLEAVKSSMDIKQIPGTSFDTYNFQSLRTFYETFMMFPGSSYNKFSNTKLLMQFVFDLKQIADNYSMGLLNVTDPDRSENGIVTNSPIVLDKSYNARNGFTFTFNTVRSYLNAVNASGELFFNQMMNSLPNSPDDRVKVLLTMISKELRVSRGLGRSNNQRILREKFGVTTTDGSPFDNILGDVGTTILDPVLGPGSIAGLLLLNDSNNNAVLPFENRYIDVNNTNKVYIPGTAYFIDSIIETNSAAGFNTAPLRQYINRYTETVDSAVEVCTNLFDFSDQVSPLNPRGLFTRIISFMRQGATFMGTNDQVDMRWAATTALFRLANTDRELKSMLFQYMLLSLLYSARNNNPRFFAEQVAADLENNIENLSYVTVNQNDPRPDLLSPNSLSPYIQKLANTIRDRVLVLMDQESLNNLARGQFANSAEAQVNGRILISLDIDSETGFANALSPRGYSMVAAFTMFMQEIEESLGNEVTNLLDERRRTRFHGLSVSTLALMFLEVWINLATRYMGAEFQKASVGRGYPDVAVDRYTNDRIVGTFEAVLDDPYYALPVLSTAPSSTPSVRSQDGSARQNNQVAQANTVHGNAGAQTVNGQGTSSASVQNAVLSNQAILAGSHATAGGRPTSTADLAARQISESTNPEDLLDAQAIDQSLNSIAYKLFQEDVAIASALHILLVIKRRLRGALDTAMNYFTDATLRNFFGDMQVNYQDIARNLTNAQVRLLLRQRDYFVRQLEASRATLDGKAGFIPTTPTDAGTKNAVLSLLAKSTFRDTMDAAQRIRLVTVGIPTGFSKNLVERIGTTNINANSFTRDKSYDVVNVNVYKRSLEYPELVFKPKKFIFDLSLFGGSYKDVNIRPNENFDTAIRRASLLDYQTTNHVTALNIESILTNDRYSFIPSAETKRAIVRNHIVSDLLNEYIRLMTTVKLSEDTFLDENSQTYQMLIPNNDTGSPLAPRFEALVVRYLIQKRNKEIQQKRLFNTPIPEGKSIAELLVDPKVDDGTKDILRLVQFGNLVFKPIQALAQLLSPKLFDRVFTIPLDVDDFQIDYEKTTATQSGREFFEKEFIQRKLISTDPTSPNLKFKPRTKDDVVFEDFFVTIELVE